MQIAKTSAYVLPNKDDGTMEIDMIRSALRSETDIHQPRTRLICLENTHNLCGGTVLPRGYVAQVRQLCVGRDVAIHMDGARLLNASVADGQSVAELLADVDSVTLCLSKGVGAPVGAVLGGKQAFIDECVTVSCTIIVCSELEIYANLSAAACARRACSLRQRLSHCGRCAIDCASITNTRSWCGAV